MKISVVIPSYNGQKLLSNNLPKVIDSLLFTQKKIKSEVEIVVVDDGSNDETIPFMENFIPEHKEVKILFKKNGKNCGFSPTVNNGVKAASGDIVILINTDVTPSEDFILPLLPYFDDEKTFAVGCMDKSVEGEKIVLRGRGIGKWVEGYMQHNLGDLDKNDTLWVSGGSGAFKRSIWNHLGGLYELYKPYYWEDNDLSYRALKAGYHIYFEKKSTVVHKHEEGVIKKTQPSSKVKKIVNRNQNFFTLLNATDPSIFWSYFIYLPIHILRALKDKDSYYLVGLLTVIPYIPSVVSYRQRNKSLFILTDKEVVAPFTA